MGPETGLEMRLQQRCQDHPEDRARDRHTCDRAQGRAEGPKCRECGWSSGSAEKRMHLGSLQGRLRRVLKSVAATSVISDLGWEKEVSSEK